MSVVSIVYDLRQAWIRLVFTAIPFGLALAVPARAETALVATNPGLMCSSADALAKLTMPGGRSRIGTFSEKPGDAALKASGGCIDIPQGATVFASLVRQQTSIISFDAGDGRGERQFYVPNVDFSAPGPPDAPDPNGQCQALGDRMAQRHDLAGPVSNVKEFATWRAACAESPPTGRGLVDLLCQGDVPHEAGSVGRVFYWQKHAGSQISAGFLPCME